MKTEGESEASELNRYRNCFRDITEDDINCKHIYESLFFTESLTPYTKSGAKKIQWNEQQTKGTANYLNAQNSNKKNSYQLGNVQDTGGQVNMLNDLSAALRVMAKTI